MVETHSSSLDKSKMASLPEDCSESESIEMHVSLKGGGGKDPPVTYPYPPPPPGGGGGLKEAPNFFNPPPPLG